MFQAGQFITNTTINRLSDEEVQAVNAIIAKDYVQFGTYINHTDTTSEVRHLFVLGDNDRIGVITTNIDLSEYRVGFEEVHVEDILRTVFAISVLALFNDSQIR